MNRFKESENLYAQALNSYRSIIAKTYASQSEKEQEQFSDQVFVSGFLKIYQSFGKNYAFASKLGFNTELLSKSILLELSHNIGGLILSSGKSSLVQIYNQFLDTKKMLSEQYSKPVSERLSDLEKYEREANKLEKQIVTEASQLRLPGFDNYGAAFQVTWKDVQQSLKPGEAAIEFSNFQYYDNRWTDSIFYCAYIIKPGDTMPHQAFLFEERQLDSLFIVAKDDREEYTINNLYAQPLSSINKLYELVWAKIEPHLRGVTTVYYAPSGKLHKLALAAIPVNGQTILAEKYNLVTLNCSRELTRNKAPYKISADENIALFGGIQYDMDTAQLKQLSVKYQSKTDVPMYARRSLPNDIDRGRAFYYLDGSLKEVQSIQSSFNNSRTFTGTNATEEAFKSLQADNAPDILHIATHGFFYREDTVQKDREGRNVFQNANDPLLRSGLILAGGNLKWKGEPIPKDIEDGILTAKEVAAMNLYNTKLVVLSACETGLGDIKGSEGVYGLQRAFKVAGVDYIMMSLWRVPDKETQDFMTTFYRHCKDLDIQEAFRQTQLEMKSKHKDPYKWAAFVLIK